MYVAGRNATVYVMYTFLFAESRHTPPNRNISLQRPQWKSH